jgi:RimJ/RimL family protein N-acetyltransferase
VAAAFKQAADGLSLPFTIIDPKSGAIVGSTRYMNITPEHRRLEIGSTFVGRQWQRTAVNTAAKLLLLTHAFERLECIRVELKTDARNATSRAAIRRLGATEEGALRGHVICADGFRRDTVYFSILESEWPQIKNTFILRLAAG